MNLKIFIILLLFSISAFSQSPVIKSLKIYAGENETSFPVISSSSGTITIEFDVQSVYIPYMSIVFRFCDRNWIPYQNIFLSNQGKNIYYNLGFAQLPHTVTEAKYHFQGSFPDSKGTVDFPYSGNWRFYITDSQDTTNIYGQGKFYVVNPVISLQDTIKNEQLEDKIYFPSDLAKVFNITTNFYLPPQFYPGDVELVEIIDNHKINYPIIIDRNFNTNKRQYYWNGSNRFTFTARDIRPGNEYREVDLRNTDVFQARNVNAQLDKIDYSRFFTQGHKDLNGGSILTNYTNDYATYLNVTFSMRPPNEVSGNIYLVGAFNNWKLSPNYKMTDNYGLYQITIPLKRGIYDYQYVVGQDDYGKIVNPDWVILEGNNWSTSNLYQVFLYYKDPNYGGYDRIIGYKQIKSID